MELLMEMTRVVTMTIPDRVRTYLAFGNPRRRRFIDSDSNGARLAENFFAPGDVFAFSIQLLNTYGITHWATYLCRASSPGARIVHSVSPSIRPDPECIVALTGKPAAQLAQSYIDALHSSGICPENALELHRAAGPYLVAGLLPSELLANYVAQPGGQ